MNSPINPVYQRMGELWYKQMKGNKLTRAEHRELNNCLAWNMERCLRAAKLYNLSFAAHVVDDKDWQLEICNQIDKLAEEDAAYDDYEDDDDEFGPWSI